MVSVGTEFHARLQLFLRLLSPTAPFSSATLTAHLRLLSHRAPPAPHAQSQNAAIYSRSRRSVSAPLNQFVFIPVAPADAAFSGRSSINKIRSAGLPMMSSARRYISGFGLRRPRKQELNATSKY